MNENNVSVNTLRRLPRYLNYLKTVSSDRISSTEIALALDLNAVQVRKDLCAVSGKGRPKLGYRTKELADDIKSFLGYDSTTFAVIIGAGKLGKALMTYSGFDEYGLKIVAGFDINPLLIGIDEAGRRVYNVNDLPSFCRENDVKIGIITTPASSAQNAADMLISAGITAIWNFAPAHLSVRDDIIVQYENMATALALLTREMQMAQKQEKKDDTVQ